MTVKALKEFFFEELTGLYPKTEIDTFFYFLVEEYLNFQRIDTVLKSDTFIKDDMLQMFTVAVKRLQKEEPIQYILGKTEFFGLPFIVNQHTLIPRPETEELVQWVLDTIGDFGKEITILDIGTGSGCIPISLKAKLPNAKVSAIDISLEALNVAQQNAINNKVAINFMHTNILEASTLPDHYDIIISNPPYVRNLEKKEIKNNVLLNEPHLALFVEDDNPLLFYHKISQLAATRLNNNGMLFFEINQYLGNKTVQLIKNNGFTSVELKKDLFGNDRMIFARR